MDLKSLWRFSFSTNTKWMASKSFSFSGESWPWLWQPPCLQCRLAAAWQLTVHWWNISHQNDPCNWQRQIQKQSEWCLNVSKIENIYLNCWIVVGALVVHYTIHWQMKHLKIWTPGQRWSKVTRCFSLSKVQVWPLGLNLERQFCDQFYNVCRYSNKTFHNEAFSPPACVQKTNMVNTGRWKSEQWFDRNREWMLIGILLHRWFLWISHQSLYHSRCQQR